MIQKATLSPDQIAKASGTGFAVETMGVNCTVLGPDASVTCWQKYLHSDEAVSAKAPWVTHDVILAFPTAKGAQRYVKKMKGRFAHDVRSDAGSAWVGLDPQSHMSDGMHLWMGPEAAALDVVGSTVVWTACGDQSGKASARELESCAASVANAQVKRLR